MGLFKKRVTVRNSKQPERFFEEEFWIDTGALYSFVPEDVLERIGVEPAATRNLVLADGRQETRLLGFCDFSIEGLAGLIPCPSFSARARCICSAPRPLKTSGSRSIRRRKTRAHPGGDRRLLGVELKADGERGGERRKTRGCKQPPYQANPGWAVSSRRLMHTSRKGPASSLARSPCTLACIPRTALSDRSARIPQAPC